MTMLPVTLAAAAAAGVLNIWLALRINAARSAAGVYLGDGGNEAIQRRMRAQANYVEYTPFVLALIIGIELSGKGSWWLGVVALVYFAGRIGHGFGMDGGALLKGRFIGTITTLLTLLGLSVAAALIMAGVL
ncbi:MAG: MAPEG family protein [Erythrobacter sp.]|uniref:MAPEG family protein n=1 Tax=Erythrobacter sp. TaxID=1042 RepID=UPI0025DE5D8B|nr:MAPEG family protein [Erythrobacter sp.]MCM0000159.1 MAPEG family protein [Erythrobacter sp.]